MKEAWPDKSIGAPLLLALLAATAQAAPPPDFEAVLDVHRNGKLSGESNISYSSDGQNWVIGSHTRGVKGMARFMGLDERSTSSGTWVDGQPRPARFEMKIQATLVDRGWSADYDWDAGMVRTDHEDGVSELELEPGVVDDGSVNLVIRQGLAAGESEWRIQVVDEDEIDHDHYRARPPERLDTALGCMETVRVDKIRAADSPRYTYTWFARDHGWAPVKLLHGKQGDSEIESRLKSLTVGGSPVTPASPCD